MIAPFRFLIQVRDELLKVVFPSQQEVIRLTVVVIGVSVIVGAFIGGLDFLFTKIVELIVK